jgi:osmotically-inducible protein OsmY
MVRIAVTPEPVRETAVVDAARAVLTPATIPGINGLQVRYSEGVAILEGEVETDREAGLAAAVLSLEPGVRQIDNRLRIRAAE